MQTLRIPFFRSVLISLGLCCGLCVSQTPKVADSSGSDASVRLEPHKGLTAFKIGEPVILDLVFASQSPGFAAKTDDSPVRPVSDQIDVFPDGGWVRTHATFRGQSLDGNAVSSLASDPIRVPVLLNRTITFLKPGHYEVVVTTERLRSSENMMRATTLEECEPCRKTNAVGIDISEPDNSEESAWLRP